jgi:hypothetical protein
LSAERDRGVSPAETRYRLTLRRRAHGPARANGTLPRKELHEAAQDLTASQAGLIAVGEPTIEKAVDAAIVNAAKVSKRYVDAATDEIADELREALKS